jgi:hypothetical protein
MFASGGYWISVCGGDRSLVYDRQHKQNNLSRDIGPDYPPTEIEGPAVVCPIALSEGYSVDIVLIIVARGLGCGTVKRDIRLR